MPLMNLIIRHHCQVLSKEITKTYKIFIRNTIRDHHHHNMAEYFQQTQLQLLPLILTLKNQKIKIKINNKNILKMRTINQKTQNLKKKTVIFCLFFLIFLCVFELLIL